ncbi:MAG: alpha/beta fold hydrolase [Rhodomicrobium sp.]
MLKIIVMSAAGVLAGLTLLIGVFVAANWAPERTVSELKARWAPPPSAFLDVAGMKVHIRDEGPRDDKSPIVLLHGTGSSLYAWEGWVQALKNERRVIRFDLPGFGLTGPSPNGVYTIASDVSVVVAVLDKLGIERCVLGGNSLGGTISWRTALAYPSRVEKLILVDSGGYPQHSISQPIGFRLARTPGVSWLLQNTLPRFLVEQGYRNVFGDPDKVTPEMVDRSVELTQREGNRRALLERLRQSSSGTYAQRISELKLPALILWGGKDRLIPPSNAQRFHRDIAGSILVIFDDLGHAPEEEDPAKTVAAVKQFLAGH